MSLLAFWGSHFDFDSTMNHFVAINCKIAYTTAWINLSNVILNLKNINILFALQHYWGNRILTVDDEHIGTLFSYKIHFVVNLELGHVCHVSSCVYTLICLNILTTILQHGFLIHDIEMRVFRFSFFKCLFKLFDLAFYIFNHFALFFVLPFGVFNFFLVLLSHNTLPLELLRVNQVQNLTIITR